MLLGHAYCLLWILFCCLYFKERTLYIDSANQLLDMINSGGIVIYDRRYSMIINELLPFLALKLNLSLFWIVFSYAISFGLILYAIYLINLYVFKSLHAALIVVFSAASMGFTFFHGISETVQLIAYSSLFYGWLEYLASRNFKLSPFIILPFSLFLLSLSFFIHPVSVFFIGFALGYFIIDHNLYRNWIVYSLAGILILLISFQLLTTTEGSHNASFLSELRNFKDIIPSIPESYTFSFFKVFFWEFYYIPAIAFLISLIYYVSHKNYLKLGFVSIGVLGFMLISLIVYHEGDANHAMERTFLPLVFFCSLPFLKDVLEVNTRTKRLTPVVLVGVLLIGFLNISEAGEIFEKRLNRLNSFVEQAHSRPGSKYIIHQNEIDVAPLRVYYAVATETLLYSSLKGPEASTTIYINKNEVDHDVLDERDDLFLYTDYYIYRSEDELNQNYFNLSGKYRALYGDRTIQRVITCGAERLDSNSQMLLSPEGFEFNYSAPPSNKHAYNGKLSVPVYKNGAEYSMTSVLPECNKGDRWEFEIWRKGNAEASLIVDDGKSLYLRAMSADSISANGWEHLSSSFTVSSDINTENLKLYIWNPKADTAYFDDLKIQLLTSSKVQ